MRSLLLLYCLILLSTPGILAQEYSYTHYDTKDGLSGATVYAIAQSADGFIWFGTETGLSRFDGKRFKTFTMKDGLTSNEILGLYTDSRERLWLVPFGSSISYYFRGKIYNKDNDSMLSRIRFRSLTTGLCEDDRGNFVIQAALQTFVISPANRLAYYPFGSHNPESVFDEQYSFYLTRSQFLPNLLQLPSRVRQQVKPDWFCETSPRSATGCTYLFRSGDTIRIIDYAGKCRQEYLPHNSNFKFIDNATFAVFNKTAGVLLLDKDDATLRHRYFTDYTINDAIRDREGNLWFATKGCGVFKVNSNRFKNLFAVNDKGTTYIRDIHQVGSGIYVGGHNDRYWKFDAVNDSFFHREIGNKPRLFSPGPSFLQHLPDKAFINCGSSDFLDLKRHWTGKIDSKPKTAQVMGDTLLIADITGAYFLYSNSKTPERVFKGRTTCAYRLGDTCYIGTFEGLYGVGPDRIPRPIGTAIPAFRKHISFFAEGADGILWIGTYGEGVFGYKAGRIVAAFNQQNGLSSSLCRCLFYTENKLWVGTEKGINKIDVRPGVYKIERCITTADGLNSDIINTIYNRGPIVYAGTPIGVTVFDERNMATHGVSSLNMTGITVSGRALDPLSTDIRLPHHDNNITFEYAGISFLSERDITFRYRIRGLDDRWQATREQTLNYPSLPSGSYTLQLVVVNKFGEVSQPLEVHFTIAKSIQETLWFKLGIAAMALLLVGLAVAYIIRSRHRKATRDLMTHQKMMVLEQMALRAQMNPHFIFNCLNAMQQYILEGDVEQANFYLSKFAALVRDTLDNATRVFISLAEEIKYLTDYIALEQMQLADRFAYTITVSPGIDPLQVNIPNMVLQPYIENAIKHGLAPLKEGGQLSVVFNLLQQEQLLECIIEDNGAGIKSRESHGGERKFPAKGMSITDKRIQTLNQLYPLQQPIQIQIEDLSRQPRSTGTRITIYFPFYEDQDPNHRRQDSQYKHA